MRQRMAEFVLTNLISIQSGRILYGNKKKILDKGMACSDLLLGAPLAGGWIMGWHKSVLKHEVPFSLAEIKKKKSIKLMQQGETLILAMKRVRKLWLKWSFNRIFQSAFNKKFFLATVQTFLVTFNGKESFGSFYSEKICYI